MGTGEAQEMDEHPRAPCDEARHLRIDLRLVNDGLPAADRGHGAEVLVVERREVLLALDELHDVVVRRLCLLHGNRCDGRQWALCAVLVVCAVADGEDAVAALDLQFFVNDDAAAAVDFAAAVLDEWHSLNASCPDDRLRRDRRAVLELEVIAVIADDLRIEHDIDAFLAQYLDGVLAQIRCDHRQDVGRGLDELDADFAEIEVVELFLLDAKELRQGAGLLDARRAATDDDECQHAAAYLWVGLLVGSLEHVQHVVTDVQSFLQRLHAVGMFLDFLHTEVVRRRAGSENQIIIGNLAMVRQQDLASLIDAFSLGHEEFHVPALAEERTDWICDFVRREDCRRYLVQERLEELEVVTVDEQDVDIFLRKELGKLDAAEACTDNDNTWFLLILLHDKSSPKTPTNEWRMAKMIT